MIDNLEWHYDKLIVKAALYAKYAKEAERISPLYGFWCSLFIELLARAALSKIHPVLLADPQDAKNILYVFGVPIKNALPVSIPAKTVFSRCVELIDEFDDAAHQHCMLMARARNSELHSGDAAFEPMVHNRWQPEHYRVTKILCTSLGLELDGFFEKEEAEDIEERMKSHSKEIEGRAKHKVKTNKAWFDSLTQEDKERLFDTADASAEAALNEYVYRSLVECPACKSLGFLAGDRILSRKVKLEDDSLFASDVVPIRKFACGVCKLDLTRDEIIAVDLPANFTLKTEIDPVEYFGVDPRDYFDVEDLDIDEITRVAEMHGLYYEEPYMNE